MSNKSSSKTIKSTAAGDTISVDGSRYTITVSGDGSAVVRQPATTMHDAQGRQRERHPDR